MFHTTDNRCLVAILPLPTTFRDFVWPSPASLRESQEAHASSRPPDAIMCAGIWHATESGPIWVPDDDADLQHRLAIIAHSGAAGHFGRSAT